MGLGANSGGQLGTGNTNPALDAVQVGASTNWARIWAGDIQTVGLQNDGSLWFWGSPDGNGDSTRWVRTPIPISPDTNWVDVSIGYFTVFAIKADGTLWTWGNEARFYAGVSNADFLLPAQVGTDTDWQTIRSGFGGFYQLLTKQDGSLWAMDASEHRIIKPDKNYKPIRFQKIDWPRDIAAYTAGGDDIGVVLTRSGEVWTWDGPSANWGKRLSDCR